MLCSISYLCELSNGERDFDGFRSDLHCPTFFKFASLPTEQLLNLRYVSIWENNCPLSSHRESVES